MRRLPPRPELSTSTVKKLAEKTDQIRAAADRAAKASQLYKAARDARWFEPVVDALRALAGAGERCMFCSGSESSEVEHYRPKSVFPEEALAWPNVLWACGVCNRYKGDRFPPNTEPGARVVQPIDENPWDFFFVDEFGNLTPRWNLELDDFEPRAASTVRVLRLDRQALQEARQFRRRELSRAVEDSLARHRAGELSLGDLRARRDEWLASPAQPDVADFFLSGPGREEPPFLEFTRLLDEPLPEA